jgi:hypothetical protein
MGTDEASAKAFVRHYLAVVSRGMSSGDTAQVSELALAGCRSCTSLVSRVKGIYSKGGRVEMDGWRAELIQSDPGRQPGTQRFFVRVRQAPQVLYGATGEVVDRDPAATIPMRITLTIRDSQWRVQAMEIIR